MLNEPFQAFVWTTTDHKLQHFRSPFPPTHVSYSISFPCRHGFLIHKLQCEKPTVYAKRLSVSGLVQFLCLVKLVPAIWLKRSYLELPTTHTHSPRSGVLPEQMGVKCLHRGHLNVMFRGLYECSHRKPYHPLSSAAPYSRYDINMRSALNLNSNVDN